MDQAVATAFRLGDWTVDPLAQRLSRGGETIRLEPRTLRLLLCLAARRGQVVSADTLLDEVWPGVIVTPDSVYQAVAALRRLLGDDTREPRYIVTVPKQGYRLIAAVGPVIDEVAPEAAASGVERLPSETRPVAADPGATPASALVASPAAATASALSLASPASSPASTPAEVHAPIPARPRSRAAMIGMALLLLALATGIAYVAIHRTATSPADATPAPAPIAIAVLPFLDLTESMGEEVFADGMTEALIDQLARAPGLRVPAPTDAFWLKDKDLSVAQIAQRLGVAFVVDGSVRKSGGTLHVAVRLVRAQDGFVVWSSSYERSAEDRLKAQEEVALAVRDAVLPLLRGTIAAAR